MAARPHSLLVLSLAALALLVFMAGCGTSSNSTAPGAGGSAIVTGGGFTQGVITRFGTIHLGSGANERVFHTEGATLSRLDDGVSRQGRGDRDDNDMFHAGMKVKIYCDRDDSVHARKVTFMNDLEGPITAKPSAKAGATFDVLGVGVLVDANTRFDDRFEDMGGTVDSLMVGNLIELSGDFDASDVLHATFIRFIRDTTRARDTFEIKGDILNLAGSPPTQTFSVHGAQFTTDMNTRIVDKGVLADSMFVKVSTKSTTSPMLATRVDDLSDDDHRDSRHDVHDSERASVEGFITGLTGSSPNFSFTVDGTHVTTTSATRGLSNVVANKRIEVHGLVDATGAIVAAKISSDRD